jgi:hypothetical protein
VHVANVRGTKFGIIFVDPNSTSTHVSDTSRKIVGNDDSLVPDH